MTIKLPDYIKEFKKDQPDNNPDKMSTSPEFPALTDNKDEPTLEECADRAKKMAGPLSVMQQAYKDAFRKPLIVPRTRKEIRDEIINTLTTQMKITLALDSGSVMMVLISAMVEQLYQQEMQLADLANSLMPSR
jgi:hypothetical protein